jgi:4-amino-4-deoxy-L-arabinose transferase-like glycosyltransferase
MERVHIRILEGLNKYDKIFILYLVFLFIFLFSTFEFNSLLADEGTHLLLSAFYKDLISDILQTKNFSFTHAYNFGIKYLVHYPKLQIAYPPLYHLSVALAFSLSGLSESVGRLVNLIYAMGTFVLFYLLARKYFSSKAAFISTFLFSFSSFSLFYASRAMQDFTMFFFLLLAVYVFLVAIKNLTKLSKRSLALFVLSGFSSFLVAMGKQIGGIVIPFFLIVLAYNFLNKREDRLVIAMNSLVLLLGFFIPLLPYLVILNSVGGLEINRLVAVEYAFQQGEPTSFLDLYFWVWYLIKPALDMPFFLVLFFIFIYFIYRKEKHWKFLLLWFLLFYFFLSLIPNKEPRFFQLFFLPAYVVAGFYLSNLKNTKVLLMIAFLLIYFFVSLFQFISTVQYYPSKEITKEVFEITRGNVALFSEADPLFSSVLMWHLRVLDKNISIAIYRACIFDNKTLDETISIMRENNIHILVYQTWDRRNIENIRPYLNLREGVTVNNLTTEIYTVKNYSTQSTKKCNYVCLTREKICVS